jgi:hypothetical protein
MYFTAKLLQQATEERIATYKAGRFPNQSWIADLCCGMGGDLLSLAARGSTIGMDRDPIAALLARANCQARGVAPYIVTADVRRMGVSEFDAWHIDPDRRQRGRRTTRLELGEPELGELERLLRENDAAAIKLAPAAQLPASWMEQAQREWIGSRRECRQQVAWWGPLAAQRQQHTATVVGDHGVTSFTGMPELAVASVPDVQRYLFEPHPAVIAAQLTGALAVRYGLQPIASGVAYLSGDRRIDSPLWSLFEVSDVLPFDRKRIKRLLRSRGVGHLEVKVRGRRLDPEVLRRQLRVRGVNRATLLIAASAERTRAILARRLTDDSLP